MIFSRCVQQKHIASFCLGLGLLGGISCQTRRFGAGEGLRSLSSEAESADSTRLAPLRNPSGLEAPVAEESFLRLSSARVALADYDLIRRDFPLLKTLSEDEIDAWLLENGAWISRDQVLHEQGQAEHKNQREDEPVSSGLKVIAGETRLGYRPQDYGRAAVMPALFEGQQVGLIDIKGIGRTFAGTRGDFLSFQASHATGLHRFDLAVREYFAEKAFAQILRVLQQLESGPFAQDEQDWQQKLITHWSNGVYAILLADFDVIREEGREWKKPGGLILRQAHERGYHNPPMSYFKEGRGKAFHAALRKFGVTFDDPRRPFTHHSELKSYLKYNCAPDDFAQQGLDQVSFENFDLGLRTINHQISTSRAFLDFGTFQHWEEINFVVCANADSTGVVIHRDFDGQGADSLKKLTRIWLPSELSPDPELALRADDWSFSMTLDGAGKADAGLLQLIEDLTQASDGGTEWRVARERLQDDLNRRLAGIGFGKRHVTGTGK